MHKKSISGTLTVALLLCAGCTTVQKGSATGGGIGAAVGAVTGSSTTFGGAKGAVLGLGLGGVAGAMLSEEYYSDKATGDADLTKGQVEEMENKLRVREAEVAELKDAVGREKAQQEALLEAHGKVREELERLRDQLGENVQVERGQKTVTVTILSEVLFDSGKGQLSTKGQSALHEAAVAIRREFPEAEIEVRGHTDNVPIRYSKHKSNWELSSARALAVLHYLIEKEGFSAEKIRATGFGNTRPVASNDTPEGRRKNRRAEIVIYPRAVEVADGDVAQ